MFPPVGCMVGCEPMQSQIDTLSGQLGVVLIPDRVTTLQVRHLAQASSNMTVRTERPHLSLYHGEFESLPRAEVLPRLVRIRDLLRDVPITLTMLSVFGGRFVFWDAEVTPELQQAHEVALELSDFRKIGGKSSADGSGLDLTERQIRYEHEYGYPLAKKEFRPHATIGWCEDRIEMPEVEQPAPREARVAAVGLWEIGTHGRIVTLIEQSPVFDSGPQLGMSATPIPPT
jgi:2'-5' RNA ligase